MFDPSSGMPTNRYSNPNTGMLNPTTTLDGPTVGVASACTRISFLGFPFELRGPPYITRNSFSRRFRQAMRH